MGKDIYYNVIKILNEKSFDKKEVDKYYKEIKNDVEKLKLMETYYFNVSKILEHNKMFIGNRKDVCEQVASLIFEYQIKENCIMKLINEGTIYPIGEIRDKGEHTWLITCVENMYMGKMTTTTSIPISTIIFNEFRLLRI